MNADTHIKLTELHATITAAIQAQFPGLATVEFYREDRTDVTAPACLLDVPEWEGDASVDPGTGQLAVMMRFEAEFIMGFRTPDVKLAVRELAAAFSVFLHQRRWPGGKTGPAEQIHAYKSDFKPQLDQYEVWCVEWHQVVHLGDSVWTNEGIVPTTVFLGQAPEIGTGNEAEYDQVHP